MKFLALYPLFAALVYGIADVDDEHVTRDGIDDGPSFEGQIEEENASVIESDSLIDCWQLEPYATARNAFTTFIIVGRDVRSYINEHESTLLHCAAALGNVETAKILLRVGIDKEAKNFLGQTPLMRATRLNRAEMVHTLVQEKANIICKDDKGWTPMHAAAYYGHVNAAIELIRGTSPNDPNATSVPAASTDVADKKGRTPLHLAAFRNNLEILFLLTSCEDTDVNASDAYGLTPLHLAAIRASETVVKNLLNARANPASRSKFNQVPLHLAAQWGNVPAIKAITSRCRSEDVDANDQFDRTPLHYSAFYGQVEAFYALFKCGANIYRADSLGRKMLHFTALRPAQHNTAFDDRFNYTEGSETAGKIRIIECLLSNAYDPNEVDVHYRTPLHLAAKSATWSICEFLISKGASLQVGDRNGWIPMHVAVRYNRISIVKKLLRCNSEGDDTLGDLAAFDFNLRTPLHTAARHGFTEMVRLLLQWDVDCQFMLDKYNRTPLHDACQFSYTEIVTAILQTNVNPNLRDDKGLAPLHIAVDNCKGLIVKLLLKSGADPNAVDRLGCTPLHYACKRGSFYIIKILLKSKAQKGIRDNKGRLPIHYVDVIKFIHADQIIRMLIDDDDDDDEPKVQEKRTRVKRNIQKLEILKEIEGFIDPKSH